MDVFLNAVNDFLLFIEYFSFFYVIFCRDFRKSSRVKTVVISSGFFAWFIGLIVGFDWHYTDVLPVSRIEILIFVILYFVFSVEIKEYVPTAIGVYFLTLMMGLPIYLPLLKVIDNKSIRTILYDVIIMVFLWGYYLCISKKRGDNTLKLPIRMWWIVDGIMCILALMMAFFSYVVVEMIPYSDTRNVGRIIAAVGSAFICIHLFILMYYYNSTQNYRMQKELADIQNEQQRKYFKGLLEKEEETRQFRHDIINDMLEIKNYSAKHEYDKLEKYIDSALGEITNISKSSYDVGNEIVNTIINYYLQPIRDNIDIEVSGYMSSDTLIEERDLCTVCANLVKNAVEAADKSDDGKIVFNVEQGKKYLSIIVENTYAGDIITDKEGNVLTNKSDKKNHGIGINNIKKIVKKYEGRYETDIDDKIYKVKVFLKNY